jgi:hypothetical protein
MVLISGKPRGFPTKDVKWPENMFLQNLQTNYIPIRGRVSSVENGQPICETPYSTYTYT